MPTKLQQYFPIIRSREQIMEEIQSSPSMLGAFHSWKSEQQDEFLDFCSGVRGVKLLYESSPSVFRDYPDTYLHHFRQTSDTGLELELLEEYFFIPLDIMREILQNRGIKSKLDAWLAFLALDEPGWVEKVIMAYPEFRPMYEEVYEMCRNLERVMEMYSKELQELDRNTVQYMIDEMQETINRKDAVIEEQSEQLTQKDAQLNQKDTQLAQYKRMLEEKERQLQKLQSQSGQKEA